MQRVHLRARDPQARSKAATRPAVSVFFEEVHSDVWGPSPVASKRGCQYFITFTDDSARYYRHLSPTHQSRSPLRVRGIRGIVRPSPH